MPDDELTRSSGAAARGQRILAPRLLAVVTALAATGASCSDAAPVNEEHWLPGADEVPSREYEFVPIAERTQRIELVPDLVIEERAGDANYSFGQAPPSVAVDAAGGIWVYDASNFRIKVFDAEGEFRFAFGSQGEGPGEFPYAWRGRIGFLGERLFVFFRTNHTGLWDLDGEFNRNLRHRMRRVHSALGTVDGELIASAQTPFVENNRGGTVVARYRATDTGFEEVAHYATAPTWATPNFAGSPTGEAYVTTFDVTRTTNEVIGFSPAGEAQWIARTAWLPNILPYAELATDGRGRVYLFSAVDRTDPVDARPVDVFSPEGERIATSMIRDLLTGRTWQQAEGDFIYGVETDPTTFEWQVVRFRLVIP